MANRPSAFQNFTTFPAICTSSLEMPSVGDPCESMSRSGPCRLDFSFLFGEVNICTAAERIPDVDAISCVEVKVLLRCLSRRSGSVCFRLCSLVPVEITVCPRLAFGCTGGACVEHVVTPLFPKHGSLAP